MSIAGEREFRIYQIAETTPQWHFGPAPPVQNLTHFGCDGREHAIHRICYQEDEDDGIVCEFIEVVIETVIGECDGSCETGLQGSLGSFRIGAGAPQLPMLNDTDHLPTYLPEVLERDRDQVRRYKFPDGTVVFIDARWFRSR